MLAADPKPAILTEQDFDPPLKRQKATVPGYWTLEEIAAELGCSTRKVTYDITGRPERQQLSILKAYKVGGNFLVSDNDVLEYIKKQRKL